MPAAPRFPVAQTPKTRAGPPYVYYLLPGNESSLVRECFERRPWWRPARATSSDEVERHHLWWGTNGQRFDWSSFPFPGLFPTSMCNRLPGNVEVCTKTRLALNLRAWASENPSEPNFFPETFVVHARRRTPELEAFLAAARALESEDHRSRHHATWIFKPGASNRGRGIEIFARASEVERHLSKQPYASSWIVQKYVEAPKLVHGRKFDIRQFAAVAPDGSVWIYEDSYVRTCSARYDAANLDSKAIHLTNDAVQKNLETYGEHEDANKLSFDEFQRALDEDHAAGALPRRVDFERETWPAIARATARVFEATLGGMRREPEPGNAGGATFELFGLDFMLDAATRPILIEVNTSPALFRHGKYLTEMMPRMMEALVRLTVDVPASPGRRTRGRRRGAPGNRGRVDATRRRPGGVPSAGHGRRKVAQSGDRDARGGANGVEERVVRRRRGRGRIRRGPGSAEVSRVVNRTGVCLHSTTSRASPFFSSERLRGFVSTRSASFYSCIVYDATRRSLSPLSHPPRARHARPTPATSLAASHAKNCTAFVGNARRSTGPAPA